MEATLVAWSPSALQDATDVQPVEIHSNFFFSLLELLQLFQESVAR